MNSRTMVEQIGYPKCGADSGPLLPTTEGFLICAKCHKVFRSPDFTILRASREAHRASGCSPIVMSKRPDAASLAVGDLSVAERRSMVSISKGTLNALSEKSIDPLVALGLVELKQEPRGAKMVTVRETTDDGKRRAVLCATAAVLATEENVLIFDLGQPDPRAVARKAARR